MKRRARSAEPFEVRRRDTSREWLEARLAGVPELDVRRLFSGVGLYSADVIFGLYTRDQRLYFKVDATSVEEFLEKGAEPFCPRPGQTLGRYYEVPPDVADDDDELIAWARRAVVAAQPSQPPPSRSSSARATPSGTPVARRVPGKARAKPASSGLRTPSVGLRTPKTAQRPPKKKRAAGRARRRP
jgi:TfoX/Sxy family transcriptional regulator of competence genes